MDTLGNPPTETVWREVISNYYGMVSLVDTHVGRVLDALRDADAYDSIAAVFTSDHGDMLGSHSLKAKMCMFEEVIQVPLFIRAPGLDSTIDRVDAR